MDATLSTQTGLNETLQDAAATIQHTPEASWTEGLLASRSQMLDRYWSSFEAAHVMLLQSDTPRAHPYFANKVHHRAEEAYITARGRLYDVGARLHPEPLARSTPAPDQTRGATRLPRITIPHFSGRREDWESFRDLFTSLIHEDSNLSNVDKLYYLKSHVQGDAKSALDDLQITEANYDIAWKNLEARYDHRRLLVKDHLKALKNLSPLRDESSASLQHLWDELRRHRDQLRVLGRPVDSWDDWLLLFAADAMDEVTRRDWEKELETLDAADHQGQPYFPTFKDLSQFLQRRCRTLHSLEPVRRHRSTGGSSRSAATGSSSSRALRVFATTSSNCAVCGGPHYIGHCLRFKDLPLRERRELAGRERLCFNCLRRDHMVEHCPSQSSCRTCGWQHHTLLHGINDKRRGSSLGDESLAKRPRGAVDNRPAASETPASTQAL